MLLRLITLSTLVLASTPALAQLDVYGRDMRSGDRHPPLEQTLVAPQMPQGGPDFYLSAYQSIATLSQPEAVAIGDVTGDGRADVLLATMYNFDDEHNYSVFLFPQSATGTLLTPTTHIYGQWAQFVSLAAMDLDGQNGLDVVVGWSDGITPFLSTPAGDLQSLPLFAIGQVPIVEPITIRPVGRQDLIAGTRSTTSYTVFSDGTGGLTTAPLPVPNEGAVGFATGDIDGDGDEDLIFATRPNYPQPDVIHRYLNNLDGTFSSLPTLTDVCPYVFGISDMDIGDVNGDGHGDIVITGGGNLPQTCLVIFPGTGGGEFGPGQVLATYQVPTTLVVADINTDGRDDIVVLHSGWLRVGVYIQRDDGTLSTEALYPIPFAHTRSHNGIAVGDFTGDGCPDVAIADDLNGLVTLRGSGCVRVFANGFD